MIQQSDVQLSKQHQLNLDIEIGTNHQRLPYSFLRDLDKFCITIGGWVCGGLSRKGINTLLDGAPYNALQEFQFNK